eukprot:CAMPEP_0177619032 /NCGR_PEP_ID=MMETSP0419_2-20121207/26001_1 /TAXON_ID=582737 /ORGANISM="Tetraselmis sp., Strain GSL018" /LENGTH=168 /DNA_ID=CAMNT_0019118187 /DNA_START=612 /DNA_END=1118 /DNA_ORIENTATION=+
MEEATYLTKFASEVNIIVRRDELRASKIMQQRAQDNPKIKFIWSHVPVEAVGNDKGCLGALKIKSTKTGEITELPCNGLFFAIGHKPATEFLEGQIELDEDGYIKTNPGTTQTSVHGVFACGDVQDKVWRQAITAAGTGCMAALEVERMLAAEEGAEDCEPTNADASL